MKQTLPIRRLLLSLAIAGVGATSVMLAYAIPAPPPGTQTRIVCNGRICNGTGPRQYRWEVTPGNTTPGLVQVDVGVDSSVLTVTSIIAPPGWGFTIVPITFGTFPDCFPRNAHGALSSANNFCSFVMRWSGPLQSAPFVIAFNSEVIPHDVTWQTSDGATATFLQPVGNGLGPIHAPLFID